MKSPPSSSECLLTLPMFQVRLWSHFYETLLYIRLSSILPLVIFPRPHLWCSLSHLRCRSCDIDKTSTKWSALEPYRQKPRNGFRRLHSFIYTDKCKFTCNNNREEEAVNWEWDALNELDGGNWEGKRGKKRRIKWRKYILIKTC